MIYLWHLSVCPWVFLGWNNINACEKKTRIIKLSTNYAVNPKILTGIIIGLKKKIFFLIDF